MNEAVETAGMIATGALLAREVDRAHAPGHDPSPLCANCATLLTGPFCQNCGQHGHVHRTMGAFLHDVLHGVFHFEGKFWATLPLLFFRPGELTRRYAQGERAKFVSPMAIFLFSIFLMFAVLANLPGWSMADSDLFKSDFSDKLTDARQAAIDGKAKADARVGELTKELGEQTSRSNPDPTSVAATRRKLERARAEQADLARAIQFLPSGEVVKSAPSKPDNWLEAKWRHAKDNPKLLLYKIKSSAYKYSWALIPISLPFIWLLFPFRRDVGMYDHAIFATYSLTFMSLFTVLLGLLGWIGVPSTAVWLAAVLVPPFHIYKQLKGGYRLGRLGALWRTAWMLFFAFFTITFFILLLLYLGVAD
jgi:hypothetical protein